MRLIITNLLFFIIFFSQIAANAEIAFKRKDVSEYSCYSGHLAVLTVELNHSRDWKNVFFKSVKTSCGCINASVANREMNGKEQWYLKAVINTTGKSGKISEKTILTYLEDGVEKNLVVPFVINVKPTIAFDNFNTLFLPDLSDKGTRSLLVTQINNEFNFKRSIVHNPPWLSSEIQQDGNNLNLKISWDLTQYKIFGRIGSTIVIKPVLNNGELLDPVSVFVDAYRSTSWIRANPDILYLTNSSEDEGLYDVELKLLDGVRVSSVSSSSSEVTAELIDSNLIRVMFKHNKNNSDIMGDISLFLKKDESTKSLTYVIPYLLCKIN